jgi:hypothetical protein
VSQVRARFHPDFHEMVLVLMYRGLPAYDKRQSVKISMVMYTFKVGNFPDGKETQTSTATAKLMPKLISARKHSGPSIDSTTKLLPKLIYARRHSGPSINSAAQLLPKLISARRHTGPSINGTLATANTANHDMTKRTGGVYGSF